MKVDLYRGIKEPALKMIVEHGMGLPGHVEQKDWRVVADSELTLEERVIAQDEGVIADIESRGFSFYMLV